MDANALADKFVAPVTEGSLLTPVLEVLKGVCQVVDRSTPEIFRKPVIKLQDKSWRWFLTSFGGNEKTLGKRIDQSYFPVKRDKEFGSQRFEHCYMEDWEEAGNAETSWLTTIMDPQQDCQLCEACLFVAVRRTWTPWYVGFDPASPSVTTLVCGWKLWLVCTEKELAQGIVPG